LLFSSKQAQYFDRQRLVSNQISQTLLTDIESRRKMTFQRQEAELFS
jgi:hypothetical protein